MVEKVENLADVRRIVEWKYGAGKSKDVGSSPEPLTDYKNVSTVFEFEYQLGKGCAGVKFF